MSDTTDLLHVYDHDLRGEREFSSAAGVERHGPVLVGRYGSGRGFVVHDPDWQAPASEVARVVEDVLTPLLAGADVTNVEWKTRGHDPVQPALHDALLAHGLVPDEIESVMLGHAADLAVEVPLPDGVSIRRVTDEADVRAMSAMADAVFGDPPSDRIANELLHRLDREAGAPEGMSLWVAETNGEIVSCGRLEPVPGTEVAGLWGGATRADLRRRGIYRALTAARARHALDLGFTLLHSDCSPYSRPILARSGFVEVTTTTPYEWRPEPGTA
ncbi:GNAT family N-acetyltransferase [Mobilicoccus pelagius]|uniref:N-acetyltransferase domain-containing protein n=1 Tax=Mobilicoccus pelagius NBRC 104925 TaxID=1089455 RepID=H5URH5_9MICO|nr:GNAT family N-acetyltransferase [Mobilicoccus pelagius]GAB48333.1 hypothetical protein MOPEL_071_00490 [Mobilicoccus pelagius NBRC 104925]